MTQKPKIHWRKPPAEPVVERKSQDWWDQVFAMLREKPGKWGHVATYRSRAGAINAVVTALARHDGDSQRYEWSVKNGDYTLTVGVNVWMRYVE